MAELVTGGLSVLITPMVTSLVHIESEAVSATLRERQRALAMFTEITHSLMELDKSHDLRVTLMEVDNTEDPAWLRQTVRSTCKGPVDAKPDATTMTIHQGVAGRCYRTRKNVTFNVPAGSDFHSHMLDLGFPDNEAKMFQQRGAYLCSPIVIDATDEVVAVLCLDTKTPNIFAPRHTEITEWVTPFFSKFLSEPS